MKADVCAQKRKRNRDIQNEWRVDLFNFFHRMCPTKTLQHNVCLMSAHILSIQHVPQTEKKWLISKQKWRELTAGLFDKTLLFRCDRLAQLPAPIMASLNEHLCLPEDAQWTKTTEAGGRVWNVWHSADYNSFWLVVVVAWKEKKKSDDWWFNLQHL